METQAVSHAGAQVATQEKKDADKEFVKNVGHDKTE
jgi:hypothetical protein